ncbi:hypothetical protein D3C75_1001100 [compost metagenome]
MGAIIKNDNNDAVANCTMVTRRTLTLPAKAPIKITSMAIANALTNVRNSPPLNARLELLGPLNSISPTKASRMPIQDMIPGIRPRTSHCNNGTIGTYMAVIKADWLLVMVCSPMVCRP